MAPPAWLKSKRQREWWRKPWTVPQSGNRARDFKKKLWEHGYVSPNFRRSEASGKQRNRYGSDVPNSLRRKCQYHAFGLERVRHDCGDRSMGPLSWYRNQRHNADVGGASQSQHLSAWATDWSDSTRAALGASRFDQAMNKHFANGGRGYVGRIGGPVRHADNGDKRQWVYA